MAHFRVYARDASLARVAEVDDFQRLEAVPRFNAVGAWLLDVDRNVTAAAHLMLPGAGIVVTADDRVVLSGPVRQRRRVRSSDSDRLVVSGPDDLAWLAHRLAHPQPSTAAPPYSSSAYDVRSGTASSVVAAYVDANAGPGALASRRVPGLSLAPDPLIGTAVTGRARWQRLIDLLAELALAGGGLGFRVSQPAVGGLSFASYLPVDRAASVVFSLDLGNLAAFDYSAEAPEANYIVAAGGGEGTARTIREGQSSLSVAEWGRVETFRDRRDTTDVAELDQTIAEELAAQAERTALSVTPVDLEQMAYGSDYDLGDRVSAVVDGVQVVEVVRELRISLTRDDPDRVRPVIGTPTRAQVLDVFRRVRQVDSRVRDLERR